MSNLGSLILAIDTTSRRASVSLSRGREIIALWGLEAEGQQSAVLWSDIDIILKRLGATVHDVDAFGVVRGPGGFTGLRVGIAAAAGFARATGRPLYGATSLELTARAAGSGVPVWAALNAYRGEVYAQPFAVAPDGRVEALAEPVVKSPNDLFSGFDGAPLRVTGSGADAYADALAAAAGARGVRLVRCRVGGEGDPSAWSLVPSPAFLAGELAQQVADWIDQGRAPGGLEPCYVRASEAEINLKLGRLEGTGARLV